MKKNKLDNKGFTLVEIMVAAALIGGLAVVMMNIFKQQSFSQKKTEAGFELSTLQQAINVTLLNRVACTNTFVSVGNIRSSTNSLSIIRDQEKSAANPNGKIAYQTGITYGNLIEIQSINIINPNIPAIDSTNPDINQVGDVEIEFTFKKISKILEKSPNITKNKFKITVEVDKNDKVVNCYSAVEQAVDTSKKETCEYLGGTYTKSPEKCELKEFVSVSNPDDPLSGGTNTDSVSTKYLEDMINQMLVGRFVKKTGDTMTGNLIMSNAGINVSNSAINLQDSNLIQTGTGYLSTQQYLTLSDRRLKKNITDISTEKLNRLDKIQVHQFRWKNDNRLDYGFIAQEIEKIFPELVITNKETGIKAVQYVSLVPVMLEQIQVLKVENDNLKKENEKMHKDIEEIKKHLNLQ